MPPPFAAKAARLKAGVSYTGASMGLFDPGKMAETILGDVHWGALMGYCWRRFGPPNMGSDPDKGLADWLITTPTDGLYLSIIVRPHDTRLLFGYLITETLSRDLYKVQSAHDEEGMERWGRWCVETKGEKPPLWSRGPDVRYGSPEYTELQTRSDAYWAEFQESDANRAPSAVDTSALDAAKASLETAIADLKRAVYVRDVPINALGQADEAGDTVKTFHAAGFYFPPELLDDPDLWRELTRAIFAFGRGKAGIAKAVAALKAAQPAAPDAEASAAT